MDRFVQFAEFTARRDFSFAALAAFMLMIAFSFDPPLALSLAGHVALIFSLVLLWRVMRLERDGVKRTEVWRFLDPHERPAGEAGMNVAQRCWRETLLRFSGKAAGLGALLFAGSLFASMLGLSDLAGS